MFAKSLGIEIFVELGWGKPFFHAPQVILHNSTTVEIRVFNSIIILNRALGGKNVTNSQTNETG